MRSRTSRIDSRCEVRARRTVVRDKKVPKREQDSIGNVRASADDLRRGYNLYIGNRFLLQRGNLFLLVGIPTDDARCLCLGVGK